MDLATSTAIVTGAASGIGRATAQRLACAGAVVVVADIDTEGGEGTVGKILAAGGRALFVRTDVTSATDVETAVSIAERVSGRLDIVVNNAGIVEGVHSQRVLFPDIAPDLWARMLDVNLRGVILGTQYAIAAMRRSGGGAIVNISSGAGLGDAPHDAPVYAAAKAAVVRFTTALSVLREQAAIRVNCICPGWVDTAMTQRFRAEVPEHEWAALAPPQMLQPEDIANAVTAFVEDTTLAGRVMLYLTPGEPWQIL